MLWLLEKIADAFELIDFAGRGDDQNLVKADSLEAQANRVDAQNWPPKD